MAQFDADVKLRVAVENLEQSVRKVENAFKKVQDYRVKVKVDGQSELNKLGNSFKRLASITKGLAAAGGLGTLAVVLKDLEKVKFVGGTIKQALGPIDGLTNALGNFTDAAVQAAVSAPGLAAALSAGTVAAVAFAPQIARATKDVLKIGKVAAEAQTPVENLFKTLGLAAAAGNLGGFGDAAKGVEEFRRRIFELNESVSNLRKRSDLLKSSLNKFNSGSITAEKIARRLVEVNRRLNDELREQADLLRRASGVNVTELEAAKGRKSAETRGRAESFRSNQARENAAVQASLERLEEAERAVNNARLDQRAEQVAIQNEKKLRAENNESIKSLERRAQLEERIAKQRSARIARETNQRASFLRGNPNQYAEGAVGPQSGGFAARQASIKQAQQRFAIQSNITKSLAGQTTQYRLQLALLQKAAAIGQQINASTKEQESIQRRINREVFVKRGRELQRRRKEALTNATIGGAFPLLFGQGAGASLGGGLGGGLGGLLGGQAGFAGSLVGTAVGQSFDNLINSTAELGRALSVVSPDVDKITEALGVAGTETEKYIKALQDTGQATEAAAFAVRKLEELVGSSGVAALDQFGRESQELTNELSRFFTQLQAGLAELINSLGILRGVIDGIKRSTDIDAAKKARGRSSGLDSALDALAEEQSSPASGLAGMGIGALIPQDVTEAEKAVLREYNKLLIESGEILDANAIKAKKKLATQEQEIFFAKQRLILEQGNNDILNSSVEAALRSIAAEKTRLELIAAGTDLRARELVLINAATRKLEIDNALAAAKAAAANAAKKSAGPKPRESQVPQLTVNRDLSQQLLENFKEINAARVSGSKIELLLAREKRVQLELDAQIRRIQLEKIPDDEKALKIETAKLKAKQAQLALTYAQAEADKRALESAQNINLGLSDQLDLINGRINGNEEEVANLIRRRKIEEQIKALKLDPAIEKAQLESANATLTQIEAGEKRLKQLAKEKELYAAIESALVSGITSAIMGLIDGTQTLEESLKNILRDIGQILIRSAVSSAVGGIFPGNYSGGPLASGSPSIVGERGPELFVPNVSGRVVNNEQFAAARQAMASGAAIQSDAEARQSEAQLFQETVNGMEPIDIRYDSTQINSVTYVTEEQMLKSNKMAVKEAQAKVFASMRNKPATRAQIGVS